MAELFEDVLKEYGTAGTASNEPLFQTVLAEEQKKERIDSPVRAALEGAARTASLGLSDVILAKGLNVPADELEARRQTVAGTVGEIGGLFTPGGGLAGLATKGLTTAAKAMAGAEALPKLVTAAQAALASKIGSEAAKKTAGAILSTPAARAAGSAIEGAFYGAGQVLTESVLGDPKEAGESALATIGLSAFLGGAIPSALNVASRGIKSAAQKTAPAVKKAFGAIRGIDEETINVLARAPEKLDELERLGTTVPEVKQNLATKLSSALQDADKIRWEKSTKDIADILNQPINRVSQLKISPYIEKINAARSKILSGGVAATPEVERYAAQLDDLESRLYRMGKAFAGLSDDAAVKADDLRLPAGEVNLLRQQYNASGRYDMTVPKPIQGLYRDLADVARNQLDEIDPQIRKINQTTHNALQALDELRLRDFDQDTMKRVLFARKDQAQKYVRHLKTLDEIYGTDFVEQAKIARAFSQVHPGDQFSSFFSGRSLLAPALAAVGASPFGAMPVALSTLGAGLIQSPAATPYLVKAGVRVKDAFGKSADEIARMGGNTTKIIPQGLVPWVSAHIAALAELERDQKRLTSDIERTAKSFGEDKEERNPPLSISVMSPKSLSIEDRKAAMQEKLEKLAHAYANANEFDAQLGERAYEVALVAPRTALAMSQAVKNAVKFLQSKAPMSKYRDDFDVMMNRPIAVSDASLGKFERYLAAIENPKSLLDDLKAGRITSEAVEAVRSVYPGFYNKLVERVMSEITKPGKRMTYADRKQLATLLGNRATAGRKYLGAYQQNFAIAAAQEAARNDAMKMPQGELTEVERVTAK